MDDLIVDRIKLVLEEKSLSPSAFADAIDIQRSSVSHIMSGRNKPSLDVIQKILYNFPDINPAWLLTGKGKMKQLDLFENVPPETKRAAVHRVTEQAKEEPIREPEVKQQFIAEQKSAPVIEAPVTITPPAALKQPSTVKAEEPVKELINIPPTSTNKQIEKILVFYTDKTFSVYKPE